jgi:hypothetical protein
MCCDCLKVTINYEYYNSGVTVATSSLYSLEILIWTCCRFMVRFKFCCANSIYQKRVSIW